MSLLLKADDFGKVGEIDMSVHAEKALQRKVNIGRLIDL